MRSFNSGDETKPTDLVQYAISLAQNTTPKNIALLKGIINDVHKELLQKYYYNEASTTIPTVASQQFYDLPFDFSKNKTDTITTGQLIWTPTEVLTRQDWDRLNVLPYSANFPSNYFIWNNQIGFWPTPSSSGNTITYNYKRRPTELTFADYTTGTVSVTNGSATVTGTSTGFLANYMAAAGSVLPLNLWIKLTPPSGDGNWYKISSISSATVLTLVNNYNGGTTSGASFIIGQMPLLLEDFHPLIVFGSLKVYFSTIVDNPNKKKEFTDAYNEGIVRMDNYAGSKTVNVNLRSYINSRNPNLYQQSIGS